MYCDACGAKNTPKSNYCEKCGKRIKPEKQETKKEIPPIINRLKELPKKTKIIMLSVFVLLIIAIISLCVLLNNPIKKIEDSLNNYYNNTSIRQKELENIGKILKSNKKDEKVLNKIKNTSEKITRNWVKNFNTEYKDKESLKDNYNKIDSSLAELYNYFKNSTAIEYIIRNELYDKYQEELNSLYSSKKNYLEGKENENNNDKYYAYYYYDKVIESDCYYKYASKYINEYVSGEIDKLKTNIEENVPIKDDGDTESILNNYKERIEYLEKNKKVNKIDLSSSKDYKKIYEENAKKVVEYTKILVEDKKDDIPSVIEIIKSSLNILDKNTNEYKELEELKKSYEDKMPSRLIDENRVSNSGSGFTAWKRTINGVDYDHNLHFSFEGKTEYVVYKLDKKYTRLTTKIVRGESWEDSFSGYIAILDGDKELYRSSEITKNSELNDIIDIDVSNVENLKIEFITSSKSSSWSTNYIYLVEPYLYK